jgi:uncharacterized protein
MMTHRAAGEGRGGPPGARAARSSFVAAVHRHPVVSFVVWFAVVGQTIAFLPVVVTRTTGVEVSSSLFIVLATALGLLLPTVVLTWLLDGRKGLTALWESSVRVRLPARWYVVALVGVPAVSTGGTVLLLGRPPSPDTGHLVLGLALQLVIAFVTVNWWEEVAWAGFVQVRLQQRWGAVRGAAVTGLLFALGHASLVVGSGAVAAAVTLALLIAMSVPFRFLQGWVLNRTDSLFAVGLVHAAGNATATGSVFGVGLLPRLYDTDGAGGLVIPLLAVMGLVVLVATRGRLGATGRADAAADPVPRA